VRAAAVRHAPGPHGRAWEGSLLRCVDVVRYFRMIGPSQRESFRALPVGGVKLVRKFMFVNNISVSGVNAVNMSGVEEEENGDTSASKRGRRAPPPNQIIVPEESVNLQARALHLTQEDKPQDILESIFGSGSIIDKAGRRVVLDNEQERGQRCGGCSAESTSTTAPGPPSTSRRTRGWTTSTLVPCRSRRYIQHPAHKNYHGSGEGLEGDGDGDDDFFANYTRGNLVFYYMLKLFQGVPPAFMTRDLPGNMQSDITDDYQGYFSAEASGRT
jgi:hypothetical protein